MNQIINDQIDDLKKIVYKAPVDFDPKKYTPLLKKQYNTEIKNNMMKKFQYKNIQMIPRLKKITISSAISNIKHQPEILYKIYNALYLMTGVIPIYTKSSRSISQFKLHAGNIVGCKVILRKNEMYEFVERLVCMYLPNIKGFRGISSKSINKSSISIGIQDAHIVKEISNYIKLLYFGFTITIDIDSHLNSNEETFEFLRQFNIPVRNDL